MRIFYHFYIAVYPCECVRSVKVLGMKSRVVYAMIRYGRYGTCYIMGMTRCCVLPSVVWHALKNATLSAQPKAGATPRVLIELSLSLLYVGIQYLRTLLRVGYWCAAAMDAPLLCATLCLQSNCINRLPSMRYQFRCVTKISRD